MTFLHYVFVVTKLSDNTYAKPCFYLIKIFFIEIIIQQISTSRQSQCQNKVSSQTLYFSS